MRYVEFPPAPPLRRYIESYWHLRSGEKPSLSSSDRIVPDGCAELIFNLAEPFRRFHAEGKIEIQPAILVAGQMRSYALIEPMGQVRLWGIRFRPGGAFPFLHLPMHELTDHILDGVAVLGKWARELQERLAQARSWREGGKVMDAALWQRLREGWTCDPLLEEAVRRILATEGRVPVESLFADLGLGARQIERKFRLLVGLNPKMLARIIRFQKIFKWAEHGLHAWSAVAYDCGYYDQAHLIHDFQQFSGQNPSVFLLEQTEMSAYFMRKARMSVFYNTTG